MLRDYLQAKEHLTQAAYSNGSTQEAEQRPRHNPDREFDLQNQGNSQSADCRQRAAFHEDHEDLPRRQASLAILNSD